MNQVISIIDPSGNEEHLTYDKNGNVIRREKIDIEPDGSHTLIFSTAYYDERHRCLYPSHRWNTEKQGSRTIRCRGSGVNNNFINFGLARAMGWNGPVISSAVTQPNDVNTSNK